MRRWRVISLLLLLALVMVGLAIGQQYRHFLESPLDIPADYVLEVPRGASMLAVLSSLEAAGITRSHWHWRLYNRLNPAVIQAGEYQLEPGMRPSELVDMLASGRVISHAFTIVEGWTFNRLKQALAENEILERRLSSLGSDEKLMVSLGQGGMRPEGWFLPETYYFVRGDSDLDILQRAHEAMQEALVSAWEARSDVPLASPYELLILASIVEKETAVPQERSKIAGVFVRRLLQGWRLETDPTVIYGLGDSYDGDIKKRDLRTDTPYNTYTRHGLPPTPIALPGKDALQATARPAAGSAMFFVADGSGGHAFSETLDEHNAAVRKMLGKN